MKLVVKFNLVFLLVFAIGFTTAGRNFAADRLGAEHLFDFRDPLLDIGRTYLPYLLIFQKHPKLFDVACEVVRGVFRVSPTG
jgi:hypothetical protein